MDICVRERGGKRERGKREGKERREGEREERERHSSSLLVATMVNFPKRVGTRVELRASAGRKARRDQGRDYYVKDVRDVRDVRDTSPTLLLSYSPAYIL